MNDQDKSREQLRAELAEMRQRNAALEAQLVNGKQSEAALCKSVQLYRTILDNIPEAVWVESLDGRVEAANEAWLAFAGLTPEDAPGQSDSKPFPSEAVAGHQEQDDAEATAKRSRWGEETVRDGNGNLRTLETWKVPLVDLTGQVAGTIGIARDITDQKRADEALRRLHDLERRLRETSPIKSAPMRHCSRLRKPF
jgi:PAS domain S-box-containing protein